jgi:hypothetical protein
MPANQDTPSDADRPKEPLHVSAVLVASQRALLNALDALGFPEEDDRLVEQEGRLGFITCSHERDCDDMFALIAELSARNESWEIEFAVDVAPGRAVFHTLARHRPITGVEQEIETPDARAQDAAAAGSVHDLDNPGEREAFRKKMQRNKAADMFAQIGSGEDGRARARIVQRNPRRVLAEATAADEPRLRAALREVMPNIMFSMSRRPST